MYMHIWDYQILTPKIPLKFVGLCGKHASLVKPYVTLNIPLQKNGFLLSEVNLLNFFILILFKYLQFSFFV